MALGTVTGQTRLPSGGSVALRYRFGSSTKLAFMMRAATSATVTAISNGATVRYSEAGAAELIGGYPSAFRSGWGSSGRAAPSTACDGGGCGWPTVAAMLKLSSSRLL